MEAAIQDDSHHHWNGEVSNEGSAYCTSTQQITMQDIQLDNGKRCRTYMLLLIVVTSSRPVTSEIARNVYKEY